MVREIEDILNQKEQFDELVPDNHLPGSFVIAHLITRPFKRLARKNIHIALRIFCRTDLSYQLAHLRLSRLLRSIKKKGSLRLLFLCKGNICRSPFAALLMQHYLNVCHLEKISTDSAGFIEAEGRPSPEYAVKAANAFGVDLAKRSSKSVNRQLLEGSDIIFCMDVDNYLSTLRKNGLGFKKTFFLGHLSHNPGKAFIEDPYEGEEEDFVSCYHHIDMCIQALLNEIKKYFAIMG